MSSAHLLSSEETFDRSLGVPALLCGSLFELHLGNFSSNSSFFWPGRNIFSYSTGKGLGDTESCTNYLGIKSMKLWDQGRIQGTGHPWTDCNLAGALGLLRILIYKVYADGTTTMCTHERKASIREFYAVIFPSLMQLHERINEVEDRKQKAICLERYRRRDEDPKTVVSEIDDNIEEECGICMEINVKVVLPTCSHAMCIKCYREWRSRSQSCPFCRDSLKRVNSADLWIYTDSKDIVDMATVRRENLRRLFMYIDKLPTVIPESVFDVYDSHVK
ncbi:RNA-binding protein [Zea mays]|uniref:RNA-binding protein n=1 Tax=Zea mays TaxID=4577 RepID=A0A1D6F3T7_MAIZE|nr:RNA-binding protein [Zea mays]ONM25999.1 RNA-binding protein [Zea mays]